jgi:lipopolysaccharide/colanic/teichoic acid biosynthesis glycosyltransferase
MRLPSSRARLRIRLSPVDVVLAAAAPVGALCLRNVGLASGGDWILAGSYWLVSLVFSVVAFQATGVSDTIPRYISAGDLACIAKAVLGGQVMTAIALFTVNRLDGIPRSVPAIQALLLGGGLVAYRLSVRLTERRRAQRARPKNAASENVILIGLNECSVLVMKFLKAQAPEGWRFIALLDEETRWAGRLVEGVPVFGPLAQLETAIEEFATHGVRTDRVMVGGKAADLSEAKVAEIRRVCARRDLDLVFMPQLFEVRAARRERHAADAGASLPQSHRPLPDVPLSPYLCSKRIFDAASAAILLLWLLPVLTIAAFVVLLDVGSPILFWQQRVGRGGRQLHIYKLRTLRPPFDRKDRRIGEEHRLSRIGKLLRRVRIDELPQLLNVLVGDMSLIGPRPLLSQDQPPNAAIRLTVRPGITGWAQVNGGARLSASEKEALDVWYIRNACLLLDLRIIAMTLLSLVRGDRRSESALAQAQPPAQLPETAPRGDEQALNHPTARRFPSVVAELRRPDPTTAVAAQSR